MEASRLVNFEMYSKGASVSNLEQKLQIHIELLEDGMLEKHKGVVIQEKGPECKQS